MMFFGWDVSTAVVGCAIFRNDGTLLLSDHCDLRKIEGLNEKTDEVRKFVDRMAVQSVKEHMRKDDYDPRHRHFVEDRLAGFSGGGSNAGTIMRLAAFNAMVCWLIHDRWRAVGTIKMLHPSTVKAIMKKDGLLIPKGSKEKKKLTLEHVQRVEPTFAVELTKKGNPQPWCYDRADAYITGRAGQLIQLRDAE